MDPEEEPPSRLLLEISDLQSRLTINSVQLRDCVKAALIAEGVSNASLSVIFVDDATIRRINARHLGHDYATDVITFPLSGSEDSELTGEIVISSETAISVAGGLDVLADRELALYAIHGVLHLCGYDDQDDAGRTNMELRQNEILTQVLGPYSERALVTLSRKTGGDL